MRLGLALIWLALAGCQRNVRYRICDACIERAGSYYCGRTFTNLRLHPDVPEETTKLAAGKAACVELAARKGGGYAGPPYQKALAACQAAVAPTDLRRSHCEEEVRSETWNPRDGVESY